MRRTENPEGWWIFNYEGPALFLPASLLSRMLIGWLKFVTIPEMRKSSPADGDFYIHQHLPSMPDMTLDSYPPSVTHPEVQSDIPTNANEHCVGTESDLA